MEDRIYHTLAIWVDSATIASKQMEAAAQKSYDEFDAAMNRYIRIRLKTKGAIEFTTYAMGISYGKLAEELEKLGIKREELDAVNR